MYCPRLDHFIRLNQDGTIGKCGHMTGALGFKTAKELEKSKWLKQIKDTMQKDIWPKECLRCQRSEEIGQDSIRIKSIDRHKLLKPLKDDYLVVGGVLDNICNSACQSCNSELSTKIGSLESKKYTKLNNTDKFWNLPQSRILEVDVNGGEPTASKNYKNILANLPENTKIVRLERNYRSTQNILSVASKVISNNEARIGKNLFTEGEDGDLVALNSFRNGKDEAIGVSDIIENELKKKYSYNNIAILVRAIFQTREFEERFLKIGLPYRILGGTKFYERAEIKNCIAYLRIIQHEKDDLAFERIANVPKRSIGESSFKQINEYARENKSSLETASQNLIAQNLIKPKTKLGLLSFLNMVKKWRNDHFIKKINHVKLLQIILDESGYSASLKDKKDLENENRLENIKELLSAMKEFDNLESFLEHVSLATSIDQQWEGEKINLMTMHASKGLEFDAVFLPCWEEGMFPHQKSIDEKGQSGLEEERRLAYVGITRAKDLSFISFSLNRFYQGDWIDSLSSRFVDELPEKFIEKNNNLERDDQDFDYNQDIDNDNENFRSPGWIRYQKRLK